MRLSKSNLCTFSERWPHIGTVLWRKINNALYFSWIIQSVELNLWNSLPSQQRLSWVIVISLLPLRTVSWNSISISWHSLITLINLITTTIKSFFVILCSFLYTVTILSIWNYVFKMTPNCSQSVLDSSRLKTLLKGSKVRKKMLLVLNRQYSLIVQTDRHKLL